MTTRNRLRRGAACVGMVVMLSIAGIAAAQEDGLFANADTLRQTAVDLNAALLAPKNFADAQASYSRARDHAAGGRVDRAAKELEKTEALFAKAVEVSKLGAVSFESTLKVRDLAVAAQASQYEPELWARAEKQFESAARALESGSVNSANQRSSTAATYYSEAELEAIKTAIVGNARELIAAADDANVAKHAPLTLNKAKALVARAESSLNGQRYETSAPIAYAAEAEYEARHADYLASQALRLNQKEITTEQLLLEWEKPIQDIAGALDVTKDVSAGFAKSSAASVAMARTIADENESLTARVMELEAKVGGTEKMVAEERQLAQVEAMFRPNEARVIREGSDLVLRLIGLSFPSGQSVIESQYYGLLRTVQEAISAFPDALIGIEGHTDSVGNEALNMKLSQDRANSVREYLIANLGLPESRVEAFGYGATRPIASNDTTEGRAQNRRIDVVIRSVRSPPPR